MPHLCQVWALTLLIRAPQERGGADQGRAAALFVVVHADPLLAWLAGSPLHFRRHRLLVLEHLKRPRSEILQGMFTSVVAPDAIWQMLPREELAEAVSAINASDLIIGGVVDEDGAVIRFIKGDLESLVVPVTGFKATPGGLSPDLTAMTGTAMRAWVISHDQLGVLLGTFGDVYVWSLFDPCGQDVAATFDTEDEARSFLAELPGPLPGCKIVAVEADVVEDGRVFASISAVEAAGLPGWEPTRAETLAWLPPTEA
jgi:hypothetical protein